MFYHSLVFLSCSDHLKPPPCSSNTMRNIFLLIWPHCPAFIIPQGKVSLPGNWNLRVMSYLINFIKHCPKHLTLSIFLLYFDLNELLLWCNRRSLQSCRLEFNDSRGLLDDLFLVSHFLYSGALGFESLMYFVIRERLSRIFECESFLFIYP